MVAGLIYLGYLYRKHPRRITEVGLVHLDAPTAEEVPVWRLCGRPASARTGCERQTSPRCGKLPR